MERYIPGGKTVSHRLLTVSLPNVDRFFNVPVKKNLKIGHYLAKLLTNIFGLLFGPTCIELYKYIRKHTYIKCRPNEHR